MFYIDNDERIPNVPRRDTLYDFTGVINKNYSLSSLNPLTIKA